MTDQQQQPPSQPPQDSQPHTDPVAALTRERDEARDQLAQFRASYAGAVAAHRDALRAANPTLPPDLIDGESPEALAASVERARTVRDQVLAANASATTSNGHAPHVPAGGSAAAVVPMTPHDKILAGLSARKA